jgi:hypothetical protein
MIASAVLPPRACVQQDGVSSAATTGEYVCSRMASVVLPRKVVRAAGWYQFCGHPNGVCAAGWYQLYCHPRRVCSWASSLAT